MSAKEAGQVPQEFEKSINSIRGVYSSRVLCGDDGAIDEIHVFASTERRPKLIVRDIESLLLLKHGQRIDYRKISLVQVEEEKPPPTPRVRLISVQHSRDRGTSVVIEHKGKTAKGEARGGVASEQEEARLAVEAVMNALDRVVDRPTGLSVSDVQLVPLGEKNTVVVLLSMALPAGEEKLSGVSLVRESVADAGARAFLDAINRRFQLFKAV